MINSDLCCFEAMKEDCLCSEAGTGTFWCIEAKVMRRVYIVEILTKIAYGGVRVVDSRPEAMNGEDAQDLVEVES